ncbi:UxaA family hydrolase [Gracilibacillus kekensis]|uniref:D-galactarate dehydratase / Altronate hydrolase, C terminus n=1 Tax=Gracilibacillus kekensis TaxID=1027249 RepID=A0A1M7Q8Y4_9BACI|nr:UxaA family hydrolase [Gracilibacillus kekensis]SHN26877.1 D-galactarate dehydratase / Altronate hydrolase, C terminus [Gracilibacillus kekensis]
MALKGYIRENGQVGIRNKLLILPSVLCSSSTSAQIADALPNVVSIANQAGCAQVGDDLTQTERTLMGFGLNPNVGGVLIVGLGCEGVNPLGLANKVAESKKLVDYLVIQQVGGTTNTIEKGIEEANKMVNAIDEPKRNVDLSDICLGIVIDNSIEESKLIVLSKVIEVLSDSIGVVIIPKRHQSYFSDAKELVYGKTVTEKGIYYTASELGNVALMTGMVASGAQTIIHFTEDGDPAGSSISPVIKCSVNEDIFEIFWEHIDLDISAPLAQNNESLISSQLLSVVTNTINGIDTKSEMLELNDFAIHRILPTF